jgi:hypothetical protein
MGIKAKGQPQELIFFNDWNDLPSINSGPEPAEGNDWNVWNGI